MIFSSSIGAMPNKRRKANGDELEESPKTKKEKIIQGSPDLQDISHLENFTNKAKYI